ncbi:MAG TPA: cytochrome c [Longimicrobiaceae bacterium]|nr:cytochrome c [Longimicrobiaceae bacterium]
MRIAELVGVAAALVLAAAPLAGCGDDGDAGARPGNVVEEPDDSALPTAPDVPLPQGVTAGMVGEGRKLFGTTCVVCHGPDAGGTQLGPSLRDGEWLNVSGEYDEIVGLIQQGVPEPEEHPVPMPPLGGGTFTAEQVRALAAYVYSLRRPSAAPGPAAAPDSAPREGT